MNKVRTWFVLAFMAMMLTVGVQAGPLVFDFSRIEFSIGPDVTAGFSFTPTVDIAIDGLFVFDPDPDGTAVRLYNQNGSVLAAALVLPTGPQVEIGNAIYHLALINLTQLTAGTQYFLSAQLPAGQLLPFAPRNLTVDERVVINGPVSQAGFGKPTSNVPGTAPIYTAGFTIHEPKTDLSEVPEPGTWVLMASGLLCLVLARRPKRA